MAGTNLTASPAHGNDYFQIACEYYCVTVRRQAINALEPEKHQLYVSWMRYRVKVGQNSTKPDNLWSVSLEQQQEACGLRNGAAPNH